jgi:hypothetical protein
MNAVPTVNVNSIGNPTAALGEIHPTARKILI